VVKIRSKGTVQNRSIYVAVGVPPEGTREVLGLWIQETEGAKFWCSILEELRQREEALTAFEEKWDAQYPTVARSWRNRWADITPFLAYPAEIRKAIYTTNAIEALNRNLRKALKTRGHMPSDEAAMKLLYLALRHERRGTVRRNREWNKALNQFAIYFEDRLPE